MKGRHLWEAPPCAAHLDSRFLSGSHAGAVMQRGAPIFQNGFLVLVKLFAEFSLRCWSCDQHSDVCQLSTISLAGD